MGICQGLSEGRGYKPWLEALLGHQTTHQLFQPTTLQLNNGYAQWQDLCTQLLRWEPTFHPDGEDRSHHILQRGEIPNNQRGMATTNALSCERSSPRL